MNKTKQPTTAIEKLLQDYGTNCSQLYLRGFFPTKSSIYGASKRNVRYLKVQTLMSIGEAINLNPGIVLNKLIELQKQYPPVNIQKNKGTVTS